MELIRLQAAAWKELDADGSAPVAAQAADDVTRYEREKKRLDQRRGEGSTCSGTRSSEVSRASHACPQCRPETHLRGSLLTCAHARTVGAPVACRHGHGQLLG